MLRRLHLSILLAMFVGLGLLAYAWAEARRVPVVRTASFGLPDWPAGAAPIRVMLISDIHLGGPAMDTVRLTRIADQASGLRPDLILLAGDFLNGDDARVARPDDLTAPLRRLRARLGVVAVLGNHDWWNRPAEIRRALQRAGVTLLSNDAVRRGPLAIGGLDDDYTGHDRLGPTLAAMRPLTGARLMLAHTPDVAPVLPADISLVVAGHTHCGQAVLPLIGAPIHVSRWGARYLCGVITEGSRRVVVGAGLGTSGLPLRIGAPPDMWLLTLGPDRARGAQSGGEAAKAT